MKDRMNPGFIALCLVLFSIAIVSLIAYANHEPRQPYSSAATRYTAAAKRIQTSPSGPAILPVQAMSLPTNPLRGLLDRVKRVLRFPPVSPALHPPAATLSVAPAAEAASEHSQHNPEPPPKTSLKAEIVKGDFKAQGSY